MAAPAGRYVPEPLNFAVQLLQSAAPAGAAGSEQPPAQPFFLASDPSVRWLALDGGGSETKGATGSDDAAAEVPPLELSTALSRPAEDEYFAGREFKAAALAAAIGVVQRAAEVFAGAAALPEVLAPAQAALESLGRSKGLPKVCARIRKLASLFSRSEPLFQQFCSDLHRVQCVQKILAKPWGQSMLLSCYWLLSVLPLATDGW